MVHLPEKDTRDKFTARAIEGQIIGYTETHGIYKVYCKDRKIRITKNPKSRITSSPNQSDDEIEVPQVLDKITEPLSYNYTIPENEISSEEELKTPPVFETPTTERRKTPNDWMQIVGSRKSTRPTKRPEKYKDAKVTLKSQAECHGDNPTLEEALQGPYRTKFKEAMQKEKDQLQKYGVYRILDKVPDGEKMVDTKWVLLIKRDQNGEIIKFKARKVARGFSQVPGLHYDDCSSGTLYFEAPIARPESWICMRGLILIAYA
jgi:hypothetical protein